MTPKEIRELLEQLYRRQQASTENVTGRAPARPVTSMETLDLSPGSAPPVVRVALGQGTVISFSDAAGRPWEIVDNLNFNDEAYATKLIGPHLYSVAFKRAVPANITVVLKGLPRPIVITALPATDEADYLKEFTVPRFIDGVAPAAATASSRGGALPLMHQNCWTIFTAHLPKMRGRSGRAACQA
ncbi:MAG: DotH/IcmK family type IV secretion protein [Pseudomonadota bacterium]